MAHLVEPLPNVYVGPAFAEAKVRDAMSVGVVTCRPETPLRDVAAMMVGYRIHSVVVSDPKGDAPPLGIVSDLDVATAAAAQDEELTARDVASTELLTVPSSESLAHAAQLMSEHRVTHLLVVQPDTGRPAGVISALGLAWVVAAPRR